MPLLHDRAPGRDQALSRRRISRRALLGGAVAGSLGLGGAAVVARSGVLDDRPLTRPALIARTEAARHHSGRTVTASLTAQRSQIDLGGRTVTALTYGGVLPGTPIRASAGDLLRVAVRNELDEPTSVHWHGLAIRNDMDGVPELTTAPIRAGGSAGYEFVVPDPGTYWFHPHSGLQLDWGLHAPLIVDDPGEPGGYDHELVVVLDDWTVGLGRTPEQTLAGLQNGGGSMGSMNGMDGMGGGSAGASMSDSGDVDYPAYLANGRLPEAASALKASPGQRVRLRIINAAADTMFDVALAGHTMTVTHTDGFAVRPVAVSTLRIAMGERYDALLTLGDGVFPLTGVPVGKAGSPARVLIRTATGAAPSTSFRPAELSGRRLNLSDLVAGDAVAMPQRTPDTVQDVVLAGDMASYRWTINGRVYDSTRPLTVRTGALTRLKLINASMMPHPVHLHGHTFAVRSGGSARKDTVLVPAMGRIDVDVQAANPGQWMLHCHNVFHMATGMMTRLDYTT